MRAIAINIGANTNEPGFRGPVRPDGTFEYVPIPESEPALGAPTYGDLAPHVTVHIPDGICETPVHLDPEFPEYPFCERYTYGDEHAVKAGPLSSLSAGDYVFFYATLSVTEPAAWLPPEWGAFFVGRFRLERDPITGEEYEALGQTERRQFANNAHVKRSRRTDGEGVDARVFLLGDPIESMLYDRCVPLSCPSGGSDAGSIVTDLSNDSGRGPWWRRPLRFPADETRRLLALSESFRAGVEDYQS